MDNAKFQEMRDEGNNLYKLRGKLSKNKVVDIVIVPKTKMPYVHINDYSNAWSEGTFDKNSSKFVSLSLKEAGVLKELLMTMDDQVKALTDSAPGTAKTKPTSGKKRKLEATMPDISINPQAAVGNYNSLPAHNTANGWGQYHQQSLPPQTFPQYVAQGIPAQEAQQWSNYNWPTTVAQPHNITYAQHAVPPKTMQSSMIPTVMSNQQPSMITVPTSQQALPTQQPVTDNDLADYVSQMYATTYQ